MLLLFTMRSLLWPLLYLVSVGLYSQYGTFHFIDLALTQIVGPKADHLRIVYDGLYPQDCSDEIPPILPADEGMDEDPIQYTLP